MSSPSQRLIEKIQEDASSQASPHDTAESAGPAASRGSSGGSSAARTPSQRLIEKIQEDASSRASHATAASADPAAASPTMEPSLPPALEMGITYVSFV